MIFEIRFWTQTQYVQKQICYQLKRCRQALSNEPLVTAIGIDTIDNRAFRSSGLAYLFADPAQPTPPPAPSVKKSDVAVHKLCAAKRGTRFGLEVGRTYLIMKQEAASPRSERKSSGYICSQLCNRLCSQRE